MKNYAHTCSRKASRRPSVFKVLFFTLLSLAGCREQIVHNLHERDVNRVITRLEEAGIQAQRSKQPDGLWTISVESNETFRALQHLEEIRAFRPKSHERSESKSVLSSREEQRFQFERDLSREVENTLLSIDGVLEARVHLNLPPTDSLFGQPVKASGSASVLIVAEKGVQIAKDQISTLVGGASGVDAKAVSVLLTETAISAARRLTVRPSEFAVSPRSLGARLGEQELLFEVALSLVVLGFGLLWLGRHKFGGGSRNAAQRS